MELDLGFPETHLKVFGKRVKDFESVSHVFENICRLLFYFGINRFNITAAWAVDREFVIYIFWAWWAQWCPQGHQMLWGKQKQRFSLGFSRFEAKHIDFP